MMTHAFGRPDTKRKGASLSHAPTAGARGVIVPPCPMRTSLARVRPAVAQESLKSNQIIYIYLRIETSYVVINHKEVLCRIEEEREATHGTGAEIVRTGRPRRGRKKGRPNRRAANCVMSAKPRIGTEGVPSKEGWPSLRTGAIAFSGIPEWSRPGCVRPF